ncbi:MAG: hypothetical protein WKF36_00390 [Candidatus Nitrosocosmicus sp.]
MGNRIPHQIKTKVLREWLQGISRDKIALDNNIGEGSVTGITQQAKNNTPDMDLLREIALGIKKENIDLNHFAPAVRLNKKLNGLGFTEDNIEKLLDEINIHCYSNNRDEKEFVSNMDEVFNLAFSLDISPHDIPSYINKKIMQSKELDKKVAEEEGRIRQKAEEYGLTIEDLKEYRSNLPLVDKIEELKNHSRDYINKIYLLQKEVNGYRINQEIESYSRSVLEKEFDEANKKLPEGRPLDIKELVRITDEIYFHPSRNVQIIKLVRQRFANSPS